MSKKKQVSGKRSAGTSQSEAPDPKRRRVELGNQISRSPNSGGDGSKEVDEISPVKIQSAARSDTGYKNTDISTKSSNTVGATHGTQGSKTLDAKRMSNFSSEQPLDTSKRKKRRRKGKQTISEADAVTVEKHSPNDQLLSDISESQALKHPRILTREGTNQQLNALDRESKIDWTLSTTTGGQYLRKDPRFTFDGKHLVLATKSTVNVYSNKSSLLLRSFKPSGDAIITDYSLSRSDSRCLYVATKSGHIHKWRWSTGEHISCWESKRNLETLDTLGELDSEGIEKLITCSRQPGLKQPNIETLYLSEHDQQIAKSFSILQASDPILGLWVSHGGNAVIAVARSKLYFGSSHTQSSSPEEHESWFWRELTLTQDLVSFDVRERVNSELKGRSGKIFDLALGCRNGEIIIHHDLLSSIDGAEKSPSQQHLQPVPRSLHWHRNAVESVKWSWDGSYLISGGHETVLVIWQLDTDHRQYLPHLSSTIESIVVSPSGSSYAVRLANNSVVVLATSTLDPTATFSGLGLRCLSNGAQFSVKDPFPMTMDALDSRYLLAAVPASQSLEPSSFLQTFDVFASQHVSRQALVRNSATDFNTTPSGQRVSDPSVTRLKMTADGQWLTCVEQWKPPQEDLNILFSTDPEYALQKIKAKEVKLRFWKRDQSSRSWYLNTRIDGPHILDSGAGSCVLDIAVSGHGAEVATVGEDARIRIWRPKARTRDGHAVKGASTELLQTWICHSTTELAHIARGKPTETGPTASLAYSEDGSILVAYFCENDDSTVCLPPIYFLDSQSGMIRHQTPHLVTGRTVRLAFLGQYLIVLSDHLRVWDTVNSRLMFGMPIQKSLDIPAFKLLSNQPANQTFAVSFPLMRSKGSGFRSQIAVFNLEQSEPLFQKDVSILVTCLMALPNSNDFVITDQNAGVLFLRPPNAPVLTSSVAPSTEVENGLQRLFGSKETLAVEDKAQDDINKGARLAEDDSRRIAGYLEGVTSTPLSVRDLFEKVSLAYSGQQVPVA